MNFYKKILTNQQIRLKILELLSFLPDSWKIRFQYRIKTGRKVNLKSPKRYSEKIQWYKLYYRTPLITQCADKYAVREYVKEKGLGFLLNELYAVYDDPDKIDFDSLPKQYAMKANNSSGTNIFVTDNSTVDRKYLYETAKKWLSHRAKSISGERCYDSIPQKIIFEKLLPRNKDNDLPDYKFFCFNGEPYCLYTMIDYTDNHANGKLGFYDLSFDQMPYFRKDFAPIEKKLDRPANFEKMIEYARILSKDFPHVRVDFYNIDGQIIFGELTFHNASGYTVFEPDEFDTIMGDKFVLPEKQIIKSK